MKKYLYSVMSAGAAVRDASDIADLTLELDADVYSSLTFGSGVSVNQIADLSGNGNHFGIGVAPTWDSGALNGGGALDFNGTSQYLKCVNNFITTDSDTWFFVFRADQTGLVNAVLLSDYGDPANKQILLKTDNGALAPYNGFVCRDVNADVISVVPTYNSAYSLLTLTREPGKVTARLNGVYSETTGTYLSTTYDGDFTFPHLGVQGGAGGSGPFATTFFKGGFAYMLRYSRVLTDLEIARILLMIKAKKGV